MLASAKQLHDVALQLSCFIAQVEARRQCTAAPNGMQHSRKKTVLQADELHVLEAKRRDPFWEEQVVSRAWPEAKGWCQFELAVNVLLGVLASHAPQPAVLEHGWIASRRPLRQD